jgi:hypothetical protein
MAVAKVAEKFAQHKKILHLFPLCFRGMTTHDQLFAQLILIFSQNAFIALGKLANEMTGKTERNLEQAKMSIDMLDMLREKTKTNLSPELTKVLDQTLTDLRLNYVDEMNKETAPQ